MGWHLQAEFFQCSMIVAQLERAACQRRALGLLMTYETAFLKRRTQ
jgi:hypothetical protein